MPVSGGGAGVGEAECPRGALVERPVIPGVTWHARAD